MEAGEDAEKIGGRGAEGAWSLASLWETVDSRGHDAEKEDRKQQMRKTFA